MTAAIPPGVRVFIVDDDPVYRQILTRAFERIPDACVVGSATNLKVARQKLSYLDVDLVTLDVVLQAESGLDLLPWMQQHMPRVVTVLLTSGSEQNASLGVDALLLGASTLVLKPSGDNAPRELQDSLTRLVQEVGHPQLRDVIRAPAPSGQAEPREVVAVGASTGGPLVVLQFLCALPKGFAPPVLVVQHMMQVHVRFFAEQLQRACKRPVQMVDRGAVLQSGAVYVAGGGLHLEVARGADGLGLRSVFAPEEHYCRPSVSVLLRSVAEVCGRASVGVVMTGMGADGADGALAMRRAGAPVLVQDRASSVVWGMPGAVVEAGAASEVLPRNELAAGVLRLTAVPAAKMGGG